MDGRRLLPSRGPVCASLNTLDPPSTARGRLAIIYSVMKSGPRTSSVDAAPVMIYTIVRRSARSQTGGRDIGTRAKNSKLSVDLFVRCPLYGFLPPRGVNSKARERRTTRDRWFLRALLHHDYLDLRKDVLTAQTCFLVTHPHVNFYTTFDYSEGAVKMAVTDVPTDGIGADYHGPEWVARWEDQVQRAFRSEGRVEVHTMAILVGITSHSLIAPLRANSLAMYDGITDLAETVAHQMKSDPGGDASVLSEGVNELMQLWVAPIH
ncbi:hypothetical protein B0H17DRAFT_309869 [Mycena rosella]|uniref:Uncharacterized protein n=1 Tax=Mycena rosella TaxID=1033263 RepID=A0AAD7CUS2_MYCRO|nr:hypothetical protein B0H17DRAFT_309869 [Mycena rosella]